MEVSPTVAAAVTLGLVTVAAFSWSHLRRIYLLRWRLQSLGLPTFKGLPLLGNCLDLTNAFGAAPGVPFSVYTLQVISGFCQALKREHPLFYVSLGLNCYVALTKAEVVEALLSDNKEVYKSDDYDFLRDWLGTGLITSSFTKWRKHRKLLTPAFHFRILDEFQPIISDHSDILINRLRAQVGKKFFSLDKFVTDCALDIIAGTSLGVNIGAQKDSDCDYVQAIHAVGESIFTRVISPWLWPKPLFLVSLTGRKATKALSTIGTFIRQVIKEKKEETVKNRDELLANFLDENSDKKKIRKAFLEMMLIHNLVHPDDQFSDQDIEDEVNTFTFAGHDTTTAGMIWTCYLLGLYPEVQARVYQELDEIFGEDCSRSITLEDIKKINYLERVIKESQRLYPSVPYISRKLKEDFMIKDTLLPKGTTCVVVTAALHRDPEFFPEPEVFDPDRFLETNRHPYAYVPFSAGPRNCIGQRFAMLEMKTVLCNIFRHFRMTSLDPRDRVLVSSELICRPSKPIRMNIQHRAS